MSQLLTVFVEKFLTFKKETSVFLVYWLKIKELKRNKQGTTSDFSPAAQKIAQAYKKKYPSRLKNLWE